MPEAVSYESVCTKENGHFLPNSEAVGFIPNIQKEPRTAGFPRLQKHPRVEVPCVNINRPSWLSRGIFKGLIFLPPFSSLARTDFFFLSLDCLNQI